MSRFRGGEFFYLEWMEEKDVNQYGHKDADQRERSLFDPEIIFALDGFGSHILELVCDRMHVLKMAQMWRHVGNVPKVCRAAGIDMPDLPRYSERKLRMP